MASIYPLPSDPQPSRARLESGPQNLYYNPATSRRDDKDLECGGRAQRRHRFSSVVLLPKAAWRFASRRTPNPVAAAQAALGSSVFIYGSLLHGDGYGPAAKLAPAASAVSNSRNCCCTTGVSAAL